MALPLPVSAGVPDPILAAIEEHKRAYDALSVEIVKIDEWEAAIPSDNRKTRHIDEEVFETDDPRWLAHLRTLHELYEAESDTECALRNLGAVATQFSLARSFPMGRRTRC
jgi:hypothetical protein